MNAARASILALLLCWAFAALADVAVPPLSGRVVDQTGTLASSDVASLTQTLKDFETRKGSQIAVLIVPTTAPETIEQYSIRVAEAWKIGRKKIDDGAILVVAKDDRKLRIEVGYGLEGALTDVTSQRIIDEIITPKFRSGDFAGGISAGVARIMGVIDGEKLPAPPARPVQQGYNSSNFEGSVLPFIIIGLLAAGAALRAMFGRLLGAGMVAGLAGLIAWFVVGVWSASLLAAFITFIVTLFAEFGGSHGFGSSGGSYSGGSDWSSSSSSSSGSSSDSGGGGGSFGGGGASGSW
jgi:uncharacterized protein